MRTLFLLLLTCLPCLAQFGGVEQPMFQSPSSGIVDPSGNGGLYLWWDASDLSNGTVVNWVDRIQGKVLTQSTANLRPYRDGNGVFFTGGQYLVPADGTFTLNKSNAFAVVYWQMLSDVSATPIIGYDAASSYGLHFFNYMLYYGDPALRQLETNAAPNTRYQEYIYQGSTSDLSGSTNYIDGMLQVGSSTLPFDLVFGRVGDWINSSIDFNGYISRIMIWTNRLTDAQIQTEYAWNTNHLFNSQSSSSVSLLSLYDIDAAALGDGTAIGSISDGGPGGYTLTSSGAARPYWTNSVAMINDQGCAYFDGTVGVLSNLFTTVWPQPTQLFIVSAGVGIGGATCILFDGDPTIRQVSWEFNDSNVQSVSAGTQLDTPAFEHANWTIWEFIFNGGNTEIRTNNVILKTGNAGFSGHKSFMLGNNPGGTVPYKGWIAYCSIYTNWLTSVSASNVVQGLGTRYGITTYTRN